MERTSPAPLPCSSRSPSQLPQDFPRSRLAPAGREGLGCPLCEAGGQQSGCGGLGCGVPFTAPPPEAVRVGGLLSGQPRFFLGGCCCDNFSCSARSALESSGSPGALAKSSLRNSPSLFPARCSVFPPPCFASPRLQNWSESVRYWRVRRAAGSSWVSA